MYAVDDYLHISTLGRAEHVSDPPVLSLLSFQKAPMAVLLRHDQWKNAGIYCTFWSPDQNPQDAPVGYKTCTSPGLTVSSDLSLFIQKTQSHHICDYCFPGGQHELYPCPAAVYRHHHLAYRHRAKRENPFALDALRRRHAYQDRDGRDSGPVSPRKAVVVSLA